MAGRKFRFSLQKVLEVRQHEADQARHALRAAEDACEEQRERVERARRHLDACHGTAPEGQALRPARLRQVEGFRQEARQAIADARDKLEARRAAREEAREALRERRRAEEALEKLREREKSEHDREQSKAEIALLDEQAVLRHSRSSLMSSAT